MKKKLLKQKCVNRDSKAETRMIIQVYQRREKY